MSQPILYIVIPCYNEEEVLPETSKRILDKLGRMVKAELISDESRIVFVDDGSRDKTWSLIEEYGRSMSISPVSSWRTTAVIRMRCCAGF